MWSYWFERRWKLHFLILDEKGQLLLYIGVIFNNFLLKYLILKLGQEL